MDDPLIETWAIHARIVVYLLDGIEPDALADQIGGKGRSVADGFAHIHNVRLMWLKASAPDLLDGVAKIEKDAAADHAALRSALAASADAISGLLRRASGAGGKIKGFKPHATAFVGYLISHESFHTGKIDLTLRQAGHAVDDKIHYGMWEWGSR
jgi:uncharacterized damage-inducible protein DinB